MRAICSLGASRTTGSQQEMSRRRRNEPLPLVRRLRLLLRRRPLRQRRLHAAARRRREVRTRRKSGVLSRRDACKAAWHETADKSLGLRGPSTERLQGEGYACCDWP